MPAPKGNKFAKKLNPKEARFGVRVLPETREKLLIMATEENLTISEMIEKLIVKAYHQRKTST